MWPATRPMFAFNLGAVWKRRCKCGWESHDRGLSIAADDLLPEVGSPMVFWSWSACGFHFCAVVKSFRCGLMVQLFHVTAPVKAAGLSWLEEKVRKQGTEISFISIFARTGSHAQLSTALQWSRETLRELFLLGLHVTRLLAPALPDTRYLPLTTALWWGWEDQALGCRNNQLSEAPRSLCWKSRVLPPHLKETRNQIWYKMHFPFAQDGSICRQDLVSTAVMFLKRNLWMNS